MKSKAHWILAGLASLSLMGCNQSAQSEPTRSGTPGLTASAIPEDTGTPLASASPTPHIEPPTIPSAGKISIPIGSPKLQYIRVEPVRSASMPGAEVTVPGDVEANPNLISHIHLPVSGRIRQVMVREGDSVQTGQSLVTVVSPDATEAQAALREADASLRQQQATAIEARVGVAKARTSLRKAQLDCQRVRDLYKHDAIAKKEVLAAETDLIQARSDLENSLALVSQAQAGIDSAVAAREQTVNKLRILDVGPNDPDPEIVVHSPLTGKILEMSVVAGEYHSDLGASVMTVADLSSVWVISNVPESEIRWIGLGDPVHITLDAYPGQQFDGKVARVADVLDPKTRTVKVMTTLPNPFGKFRPEMFGRVHHIHDEHKLAVIPAPAVLQTGDGKKVVYVQTQPGTFVPRTVDIGQRQGANVAVLRGISPGERVVVDGAMLLR
ncbi:MAG: efflux RND transporter periplasmic adaptor subunit [Candidatus Eremiobacteraeota bacterium]|nr:efflux RND transporter periplasmic adaptor subunit [Candidatus Eremiobacteraeota bacterium]